MATEPLPSLPFPLHFPVLFVTDQSALQQFPVTLAVVQYTSILYDFNICFVPEE